MSGKWKRWANRTESRVPWLGEIPSHWRVLRLKWTVASGRRGGTLIKGQLADEPSEGLFPGYSASGQDVWVTEALYHQSGIVLSAVGARCGKAFRADGEWTAIANTHVLLPNRGFDRDFLWRIFDDERFWKKGGSAQPYVQVSDSLDREWAFPDLEEQKTIAAFLDRETAKIDALVAKKERLIELLQEKRTALISHAVTRGLNPNTPLRDSGIPWIGRIPEHWELKRLRNMAGTIQTGPFGSQLHASDYSVGGVPVINPANIRSGRLVPDEDCAVSQRTSQRLARHRLRSGDIVFARRGEMGRCGLVMEAEDGWLCGTGSILVRCPAETCDTRFLNHVLSTKGVRDWLSLESVGATMENLNTGILGRVPIASPHIVEQRSIAEHIDRGTTKLDALIAKIRTAIDRLQEYRTALISAAVTGQIDVREETRP